MPWVSKQETQIMLRIIKQICFILISILFIIKIGLFYLWQQFLFPCHLVLELIGIFIMFSVFLLIWFIYEKKYQFNPILCWGIFCVGFFDLLHLSFYAGFYEQSQLSLWYWLFSRLTLVITFLLLSFDYKIKTKTNKYLALFFTVFIVGFIALSLYKYSHILPNLLVNEKFTAVKSFFDLFLIGVIFLTIFKFHSKLLKKDVIDYPCILTGIIITLIAQVLSAFKLSESSALWGHLLKLASYFLFFKAIFVSTVRYPYEQIKEHRNTFMNIFDQLPVGFVLYDENLRLFFANKKALDLWAYEKSELFGLHHDEIVKKFSLVNAFEEKGEKIKEIKDVKLELKDKNDILHKLKANYYKFTNFYLATFEEIKLDNELLKLQTETILNSMNRGVILLNVENNVVMYNKSCLEIFELKDEDVMGKSLGEIYQLLKLKPKNKNITGTKYINDDLYEITTQNGNKKILRFHLDHIKNIQEQNIGSLILITDITIYKKESLKLQQKEKLLALGKIASGIVHEIKNPLTTIKGFSQLIRSREKDKKIQEYACAIEKETDSINKFITDFLKFAKPSPPVLKEISIDSFIDSLKLIIDTNTFLSGIKVNYGLYVKNKTVMADTNQLKQVIMNIVKNALEVIEDSGGSELRIFTKYHKKTKEVSITIFNDGKAMSEEDKMMVGTPFFTTKKSGTGLGLSICFQLIKEHNGRIEIESEEGVGTSFIIYLPSVS